MSDTNQNQREELLKELPIAKEELTLATERVERIERLLNQNNALPISVTQEAIPVTPRLFGFTESEVKQFLPLLIKDLNVIRYYSISQRIIFLLKKLDRPLHAKQIMSLLKFLILKLGEQQQYDVYGVTHTTLSRMKRKNRIVLYRQEGMQHGYYLHPIWIGADKKLLRQYYDKMELA